jgi:hypothetical protein
MASHYEELLKTNPHAASLVDHAIARQFDLVFQNEKSTLLLRDAYHAVMNGTSDAIVSGQMQSRLDAVKVKLVHDFITQQREQLSMPASAAKLEADYANMLKNLRPVYQPQMGPSRMNMPSGVTVVTPSANPLHRQH